MDDVPICNSNEHAIYINVFTVSVYAYGIVIELKNYCVLLEWKPSTINQLSTLIRFKRLHWIGCVSSVWIEMNASSI